MMLTSRLSALRIAQKYARGGSVIPEASARKIDRSAFLYMSPKGKNFAQCATCFMFTDPGCMIHAPDLGITKDMTCALYVKGTPRKGEKNIAMVTPEESGLADFQVRCQNCKYGGEHCGLYKMLNAKLPDVFDLDTKIESSGCCNGFMQK